MKGTEVECVYITNFKVLKSTSKEITILFTSLMLHFVNTFNLMTH